MYVLYKLDNQFFQHGQAVKKILSKKKQAEDNAKNVPRGKPHEIANVSCFHIRKFAV